MPIYFASFLGSLALSLLLYVAAVAYAAFKRRSPPATPIRGTAASVLQAIGFAALWSNVGVAWVLFFNIYPIHLDMHALGEPALQAFSRGYTTRLPIVVLPFGLTCLSWTLGLWSTSTRISRRAVWGIATLCVIALVVTPFAANAQGDMQEHGFTDSAYNQLQLAHAVRSLTFTIAALWALIDVWRGPRAATT